MSQPGEETRYIAVDGAGFDKLIAETHSLLARLPEDPRSLLTRWLSLRLSMTVIATLPGSTVDSQAQITELLTRTESLQKAVERFETEHVDFIGPDGEKFHPDWCRECRVDRIMSGVTRALAELELHLDGPDTPAALANVCRRVARYLTDYRSWRAPVQWETAGLQQVRELIDQYVKLETVDSRYSWVSTIEGLRALIGDVRAMHKTIERRGRWLEQAKRRLAEVGEPVINDDLAGTGIRLERGAVLSVEFDGRTELCTITDVRPGKTAESVSIDVKRAAAPEGSQS